MKIIFRIYIIEGNESIRLFSIPNEINNYASLNVAELRCLDFIGKNPKIRLTILKEYTA